MMSVMRQAISCEAMPQVSCTHQLMRNFAAMQWADTGDNTNQTTCEESQQGACIPPYKPLGWGFTISETTVILAVGWRILNPSLISELTIKVELAPTFSLQYQPSMGTHQLSISTISKTAPVSTFAMSLILLIRPLC